MMNQALSVLTPVQQRVACEIVALVRRAGNRAGATLNEARLAGQLGTSRSPVRAALARLAECGVLERHSDHGFALTKDALQWTDLAAILTPASDDLLHLRIADERQNGRLPDVVNEAALMRRFGVARSALRKTLARIAEEGWIEKRFGRGWCFRPVIDSPGAYEESCRYCQAIEPASLLLPSFRFVALELGALRQEQRRIAAGRGEGMTAIELFDANRRFHESLARWSSNRHVIQSARYVSSLQRLVERQNGTSIADAGAGALEHLAVLAAIEATDTKQAARLVRQHLDGGNDRPVKKLPPRR